MSVWITAAQLPNVRNVKELVMSVDRTDPLQIWDMSSLNGLGFREKVRNSYLNLLYVKAFIIISYFD